MEKGFSGIRLLVAAALLVSLVSWWLCPAPALAKKHSHKTRSAAKTASSQSGAAGKHRKSARANSASSTASGHKVASSGGKRKTGVSHAGDKESVAAGVSSKSKRHRRHAGPVAEEPGSKGKGAKGKLSARHKPAGSASSDEDKEANEPKAMPPNYEAETRLLAKAYKLRDQALNEQMRGDLGEAVKHLHEACEISGEYYQGEASPTEAPLYYDLAAAAEAAGQIDLAVQSYRQCIERNARMPGVRVKLAVLLAKQGESEEAMSEARKAAEGDPEDPRPHHLMGLLLERKGDLAGARQEQERSKALLGAKPVRPQASKEEAPQKPTAPSSQEKPDESKDSESETPPADMPLGLP